MKIKKIKRREELSQNKKYVKAYRRMEDLITAINKKEIPDEYISIINEDIDSLNSFSGTEKELVKRIKKTTSKTIKFVGDKLKLVSKHCYRSVGLVMGMLFGPIFTLSFDGLGYNGLGMVLGMFVGIVIGTKLDDKAAKEGKQLDVENIEF